MKKQILLLIIIVAAAAVSAAAQTTPDVPQFPPGGSGSTNGGSSREQNEVVNPPRKKRYLVPAIRIAFGIMEVVCSETGRCPENDFRRPSGPTDEQSRQAEGGRNRQVPPNLFRQLINRQP